MRLNKYILYVVVLIGICMIFLAPRLYYYYTYERSIGKVTKFYLFSSHGRKFTTHKKYPIIEFDSKEYHIKFTGPAFMSESVKQDDNVPVIYDKKIPKMPTF